MLIVFCPTFLPRLSHIHTHTIVSKISEKVTGSTADTIRRITNNNLESKAFFHQRLKNIPFLLKSRNIVRREEKEEEDVSERGHPFFFANNRTTREEGWGGGGKSPAEKNDDVKTWCIKVNETEARTGE